MSVSRGLVRQDGYVEIRTGNGSMTLIVGIEGGERIEVPLSAEKAAFLGEHLTAGAKEILGGQS